MSGERHIRSRLVTSETPLLSVEESAALHLAKLLPPGSVVFSPEQVAQVREDVDFLWASIHWEQACAAHDRARDRALALLETKP